MAIDPGVARALEDRISLTDMVLAAIPPDVEEDEDEAPDEVTTPPRKLLNMQEVPKQERLLWYMLENQQTIMRVLAEMNGLVPSP